MVLSRPLLLCCALSAANVNASADFPDLGKYTQLCEPYTCRAKRALVPVKDFEFTTNGCGTSGMSVTSNQEFLECCNWHDACYSVCGMPKANCEKRFQKCLKEKCGDVRDATKRGECLSAARIFYVSANMIACPAFHDAQKEACECVPTKEAADAIRERLVYFLEVNGAPEDELADEALDALLAKYKGREHTMFLRLLKKYPDALKLDPQKSNYLDDVVRDADESLKDMEKNEAATRGTDEYVDEHEEL